MNYYEHHLGDWAAATGHLTWDEDMAYTRLLRAYYHAEKAIPEGQQYRLAKASTPAQRKAVDAVLAEFFSLQEGAYHQKRADIEIARYQDKQRKAKASANARWSQSGRNANASPDAMRTHSEGNAHQTPDTRHQTPSTHTEDVRGGAGAQVSGEVDLAQIVGAAQPTAAGAVCLAMRKAGVQRTNPSDPRLLALVQQGATPDEFAGLAAEAIDRGISEPWAWVLKVLPARRQEAAGVELAQPAAAQPKPNAWADTDAGLRAMAAQLGTDFKPGEGYHEFTVRVKHLWRMKGAPVPQQNQPIGAAA
jgi:uncharacterized protein YdaU (DUF1376 family)